MTEQEMNIAIAEHFGYIEPHYNEFGTLIAACFRNKEGKPIGIKGVPQWTKCLNIMHEAEKVLTDAQWVVYISKLHDDVAIYPTRKAATATARQRAEAFVCTLGLRED